MDIEIHHIGADELVRYGRIPIAYEVTSVLQLEPVDEGLGGIRLREEKVDPSYVKDYDAYESGGPAKWSELFDVRNWGHFLAMNGSQAVGGATVACRTPGLHILGGRSDIASLWDLRVHPDFRHQGLGTRLFEHAVAWTREQKCARLKIETQNVNVPACRLYAKLGCRLGEINAYGYAGHPEVDHEVMLIWYLDL